MEKRGIITDETPREDDPTPPAKDAKPVHNKQAADDVESHASVRAADAVADESKG